MSEVFADAFYFVARLNRRDQHHARTNEFSLAPGIRLVTSEWVLVEVADALAKSDVRPYLRDFFHDLHKSSENEIILASSASFDRALDFYHQHRDKEWTLTDCTSFLIMRERGITEALTGDRHFEQAGFVALLK